MNTQINSQADIKKPRILLLATGGTIAAQPGRNGLVPALSIEALLQHYGAVLSHYEVSARDILQLDSSNIQPEEWQLIARAIDEALPDYDGIVITHGTDTMAYTASVLSFMLQNLHKPVVLTGSQLPIEHPLTDALGNLAAAMAMAASGKAGVFVAFNQKIILGTRAVKTRTTDFSAFQSINAPYVAEISADGLIIDEKVLVKYSPEPSYLNEKLCTDVFLIKLTPGLNPQIFSMLLQMNYKGLVIEAFGIGGLHFLHRDLVSELDGLIGKGIPVVVTSQCLYEKSDFSRYESGRLLKDKGAIEAFDMTTEAAVTKLMWALGQTDQLNEIAALFARSLCGEISLG